MNPLPRIQPQTLAIVHLDTSAGPMRISVSEEEDGTLFAERVCSRMPHVFPVRTGTMKKRSRSLNRDASKLVQEAIDDIESFAEVKAARQINLP
jgi:hypothetical protein